MPAASDRLPKPNSILHLLRVSPIEASVTMESLRSSIEGSQPPSKRQKRKTVACAQFQTRKTVAMRLTTMPIDVVVAMIKRQNVMAKSLARIVYKQTRLVNIRCGIEKSL